MAVSASRECIALSSERKPLNWLDSGIAGQFESAVASSDGRHASHEVNHEGVAQRAHNLSPVPFGAAKRAKESSYHCSDTASQRPHERKSSILMERD